MKVRSERMSIRRRVAAAVVLLIAGIAGVMVAPQPAMAVYEGHCEGSYLTLGAPRVISCWTSGTSWFNEFQDRNSSYEHTVLHLQYCSSNPEIRLERREGTRWENMGSKIFYCLNQDSGWLSWGDMDEGLYRWYLVDVRWAGRTWVSIDYYHGAW
jgi:hypothetical protein